MKIEDVEAIEDGVINSLLQSRKEPAEVFRGAYVQAIQALHAEAWHPIERAEELRVKDGRTLLGYIPLIQEFKLMHWNLDKEKWLDVDFGCYIGYSHFRFINPPEEA